jgi:hypothetical protein
MKFPMMRLHLGVLAALALVFAVNSKAMPPPAPDSEQISKLLVQAKSHAVLVEDDAADLEAFTRSKLSWKTHALKLQSISEHINALGQVSKELLDLRPQGSPWQQMAIDQIDPLLKEMASNLTITINHLRDNQSKVHLTAFREYAHGSYEYAARTAGMIRDFVEYDKAKSMAESLEAKLSLPADEKSE